MTTAPVSLGFDSLRFASMLRTKLRLRTIEAWPSVSGRSVSVRRRRKGFHGTSKKLKANGREFSVELPMNNPFNLKLLHGFNEYSLEASYAW